MIKVGLTGGLASGKSFIGTELERLGAHVLEADKLGHAILMPDGEAYADVVKLFGNEILSADNTIDRKKVGAIVFTDPEKLKQLNALVHPHVFNRQKQFFAEIEARDPDAVAVVEAAIMVESGSYENYDRLILAACPRDVQIARFVEREKSTVEEAESRLDKQMPLEDKRGYADFVIDTAGSRSQTLAQVEDVYRKLRGEAQRVQTEVC
jgi:dephospho-CoA kinase